MIRQILNNYGWNKLNGKYITTIDNELVINDMGLGISIDADDYDLSIPSDRDALVEYLTDCLS